MNRRPTEHRLAADDATELTWYELGAGPPIAVAGGLVGRHVIWQPLWDALGPRFHFVGWDYRGLWGSSRPREMGHFSIDWHADDLRAVLDAAGVERTVLVGWSTGVQVGFEFYRKWPERVAGLVLICGTYGRAFEGALGWQGTHHVIPRAAHAATHLQQLVSSTLGRLAGSRRLIRYLKLTGAVGPTADEEALRTITEELAHIDVSAFMTLVRRMEDHDATDLLEAIDVPVLVVSGDRDVLIPKRIGRKMVRRIPQSELLEMPGATHYAPIEYPELLSLRVEKFLRDIGWDAQGEDHP